MNARVIPVDQKRWELIGPNLTSQHLLVQPAFEKILAHPGLLAKHPTTWGRMAADLLARLVTEHQRRNWPSTHRFEQIVAEQRGQTPPDLRPFEVTYEDHPDIWYFQRQHAHEPEEMVAEALEQALRATAADPVSDSFRVLANALFATRFAIAVSLPLVVLYDDLREDGTKATWHGAEVVRLLALDIVGEYPSLLWVRRLLRHHLHVQIPTGATGAREAILRVIRQSPLSELGRVNELADIETWACLSNEERAAIALARNAGNLFLPTDRRKPPSPWTSGFIPPDFLTDGNAWPHEEDRPFVEYLAKLPSGAQSPKDPREREVDLIRRLDALKVVLTRPEAREDRWLGECLGWCCRTIADLKVWELEREGKDPKQETLDATTCASLLSDRAPWWKSQVESALRRLQEDVPRIHQEQQAGSLGWGSADPVYQSLTYLDEALATQGAEPFTSYQQELARIMDKMWSRWPPFTRAKALCVLRPYYWAHLAPLRRNMTEMAETEPSPLVLEYYLRKLIAIRADDVASCFTSVLRRTAEHPESADNVQFIGKMLGQAVLSCRGDNNPNEALRELAALFDVQSVEAWPNLETRRAFISGVVYGAMFVLEQRWPPHWRRWLYEELADSFVRILQEGTLGEFCWLHFELRQELGGTIQGNKAPGPNQPAPPPLKLAPSDGLLIRLCQD